MKKYFLILIVCFIFTLRLIAQEGQEAPKVRFEKVSEEELNMKSYPNDTTADAVILYDEGSSYIKYEVGKGFMLTYERFVRIKILKQNGVNWGNFYVPLYSNGQIIENTNLIKGTTTNLENGKIVKSELKKSAIFRERENKYWEAVRLSMPSVKVGSVVDLQYSIVTNQIWNLRTWKFQYSIPVKWSQYTIVYPEFYTFNQSSMGYHSSLYAKNSRKNETVNYTAKIDNGSGFNGGGRQSVPQRLSYMAEVFEYAHKDVPAMKAEPYLTSLDNFTTLMKFELANINFTKIGGKTTYFTTSWIDIAQLLNKDEHFGMQLKSTGFVEEIVTPLTKGTTDEQKKLDLIYNHLQHVMKWDGQKSAFTDKSLKQAYSDKTGNSASINLLLTVMLNKAGITANPVVLSTREHGILSFSHPTISDCNYVIVQAVINGKPVLLDATEPNLQAGLIPFRCLNGTGHLIKNGETESVQLLNPKSTKNTMVQLEIIDGKMNGIIKKREFGLSAFDFRQEVKSAGGKQEYFDKIKNSSSDVDFTEYHYNNLDSLSQPVYIEYKVQMKETQEKNVSIIYIDAVLIDRLKDNPFKSPTREYPIDFGVPFNEVYNLQLTIPEGYLAEELPKSKSLALEGKAGQFQYEVAQIGNKIVLSYRLSIDKTLFLPSEYQALKNFYDHVINKQAEQIILKKTTI